MSKEWKKLLVPDDEKKMNEILIAAAKHRTAYTSADDVKVAQLWCIILEMEKRIEALEQKIYEIETNKHTKSKSPPSSDDELIESHEKF